MPRKPIIVRKGTRGRFWIGKVEGSIPVIPTGDGAMNFSEPAGDNTGLLALLEDI